MDISDNNPAINTYDEYGIPGGGNTGRFQYTGQTWLPELGMYYYKARMYSPTMGRFLQTDPIGYKDQVNLYAYVANDPVNETDPTGLTTGSHIDTGENIAGASSGGSIIINGPEEVVFDNSKPGSKSSQPRKVHYQIDYGNENVKNVDEITYFLYCADGKCNEKRRLAQPRFKTEKEARVAAEANGWKPMSATSLGKRARFYKDDKGGLWTRDRDGHSGGAWKRFDRTGIRRLGTYDENLNRILD